MAAPTVHVGSYEFDHVIYDKDGDVLYLSIGTGKLAADTWEPGGTRRVSR